MARPLRIEFEGAVYHVTARGNERKKIFFVKRDFERFKEYLSFACERFGCFLHGYVLMSNHYHLILETPAGNLSKVMHYINSSYTTYVNARHKRRGHLLQGRYKAIVVDKDTYLLELSRYLHLNPMRAGMVAQPVEYPHSSYRCFIDGEIEPFLSTDLVLAMMVGDPGVARQKYRVFVESAIGVELKSPFIDVYGGTILGSESFIKDILKRLQGGRLESEEVSYRKKLGASVEVDQLLGLVCAHCNCLKQDLPHHGKARKMVIYLLKMHTPLGNRGGKGSALDIGQNEDCPRQRAVSRRRQEVVISIVRRTTLFSFMNHWIFPILLLTLDSL